MGLYIYLSDEDRINMRKVNDLDINDIFQEALKHDKSLMLSETSYMKRRFLRRPKEIIYYSIYHECFKKDGNSALEARQQLSASGSKAIVLAYLYGIINGSLSHSINLIT